ncbi:MAG TPA: hypothetical protein VGM82_13555 [Gemmatimonadaceae bacterium]
MSRPQDLAQGTLQLPARSVRREHGEHRVRRGSSDHRRRDRDDRDMDPPARRAARVDPMLARRAD